jgi:hypothetical protein
MQRAVGVALAAAQRQAPRRTGRLAAGLRGTVADAPGGGLVGVVDADKTRRHIARFLELGTAQHVITARRGGRRRRRGARALVFEGVGGLRFAMRVRHPGIRARHWLQTAGLAATPSIVAAFQEAMRDVAGAR